ncbi:LysR family transcriptional regulator [Allosphingosinicella indica]|uniref:Transcriptional regulator, LysR family n=1 Tax=Allosphingosinicella indica TaxID=941907 RepID=A0A1X7H2G1_9SPHN|nr:LysR family transcriptional regulator [Allosphingosinicella indica]SMF78457.1 transcriptional regulator, LysR family [Allosphingosinicella indica]
MMFDWNDLRAFLAVAEAGSTLAAARALRVSQTTVARRIAALEAAIGLTLFEKRQAGYALTPIGQALVEAAREVASAAGRFADAASGAARDVSGAVRITTLEIYAVTILPPILRDLHDAHPGIQIELDMSEEPRDLAAGAADIALRNAAAPDGPGLVRRKVADDPWTLYCSRAFADAHGVPRSRDQLAQHPIVGGGGDKVWRAYRAWLQRHDLEGAVAMHQGSVIGLLAAVRSGIGLAILPSFVADRDPDLIRCLPPREGDPAAMWLLTHERLRHVPRIRTVLDFLGERLTRLAKA